MAYEGNTPRIDEDPEEWRLADKEPRRKKSFGDPRDRSIGDPRDRSIGDHSGTSEYDNTSNDDGSFSLNHNRTTGPRNRFEQRSSGTKPNRATDWRNEHADLSMARNRAQIGVDFDGQQQKALTWKHFTNRKGTMKTQELKGICEANFNRFIDLAPYMIDGPHVVQAKDYLQRVLDLFRHMQLRHLPVMRDGQLVGIITRHDLFEYMKYTPAP